MKHIILFALTVFVAFSVISCNKDSASLKDMHATILGKWNITNDSTFEGVGINNHPVNYTGKTGDYFDFRTDGNLYI